MQRLILLITISLMLQSCHYGRMALHYKADIDDHKIFPYTEVNTGNKTFYFKDATNSALAKVIDTLTFSVKGSRYPLTKTLDDFTETTAFLVIKSDSILYEHYFEGYKRDSISNIFSVSKSVTSLLVGIAVDEGTIHSVQDPITKYIPELAKANPKFNKMTLEHLLNMRSGLKFEETYRNPFDEVSRLYYGTNQLRQIKKLKFEYEPGEKYNYQSVSTTLLGIAVERATGKELGKYLEEKIWVPLQMENDATWSLDDKQNRNTKAFCCLNTTAIDLAKIARLVMNNGRFNNKQIISEGWIKELITPNPNNEYYQYQWYGEEGTNDYYAVGILGQVVYIIPDEDLIIIRLGKSSTNTGVFISKIKRAIKENTTTKPQKKKIYF